MNPDQVWTVYNNISGEIVGIFAEMFLAQRACERVIKTKISGTVKNEDKYVVITLSRALDEIREIMKVEAREEVELEEINSGWGYNRRGLNDFSSRHGY